jgi:hypothetical protein
MPADPVHPGELAGQARFRADLVAHLDSLPVGELAELLGDLPSSRQKPLGLGVLMIALNERLPDAYKMLPPAGHPGPGQGRRRTLRELVADRRAARAAQHAGPPPSGLAEWLAARQQHGDPPVEPPDRERHRQDRERDREPDEFGNSWRTYRERAEHIRQAYGWKVPQPPPRAENWLPLGADDDQEHDQPPDRSRRWHGDERDNDRKDR